MGAATAVNNIEQTADRALAYALLARLAKDFAMRLYRIREVDEALDELLGFLTQENVDLLVTQKSDIAMRLIARLGELHAILAAWSRSPATEDVLRIPYFSGKVRNIQDRTEDLGDIVESIALSSNEEFRSLISCCAGSLITEDPEELVARMQD
jgi:hypothetical protein